MLLVRRFLVVAALMFWQGGFTFYAGVVVPIGRQELGPLQSEVTRPVTFWLNVAGAVALAVLAWDGWVSPDPSRRRRVGRGLLWFGLVVALVALFGLHRYLGTVLDAEASGFRQTFRPYHRLYLWISTVQWGCGILYLLLTLGAWRAADAPGVVKDVSRLGGG